MKRSRKSQDAPEQPAVISLSEPPPVTPLPDTPPPAPSANDELGRRIDGLAQAVSAVRGRIDDAVLEPADALTSRVADRLRLSGEHTIVALAGATGSGKSSLFNALTDMELAGTGVQRPTTSWALACSWGPDGAAELLEWMGIPPRHQVSRMGMLAPSAQDTSLEGLVLLDLPDHDSTEVAHHVEMDRLVQYSDLLIWVLDPQKYADAAIHERYIRPMAAFNDVTLVVLNQIDRLPYEVREQALADVQRLVVEDGLGDVRVLGVSATRGDGLDDLLRELAGRIRAKDAAKSRLMADVRAAADAVDAAAGSAEAPTLTPALRQQLTDDLAECAGVPQITAAIRASTLRRARRRTSWPIARWLGKLRTDRSEGLGLGEEYTAEALASSVVPASGSVQRANAGLVVRQLVDELSGPLASPWRRAIREAAGDDGAVAASLDEAVGSTDLRTARIPLWWRTVHLVQWLLLLGAVAAGVYAVALALEPRVDLAFDVPEHDDVAGIPWAAAVAGACLVAGLVLGVASRIVARVSGRRRAQRVRADLHESISRIAEEKVVAPVERVLADYGTYRRGLLAARG